jgi:hypothetical protein
MATPLRLRDKGELVKIEVPLGPGEGQPIRELFGLPSVKQWIDAVLPGLPTEDGAAMSPKEELDELLFNYISSKGRMIYTKTFKDLIPSSDECWELKTWQLRVFGWFYRKDCFIAVHPDLAVRVKRGTDGYRRAINKVKDARQRLPLDEPKFVGGVLSNVISI